MTQAVALLAMILGAAAAFAQEPVVQRSTIWMDAVKRGDMAVRVRGLGVLTPNLTAELNIPESQVKHVQLGQAVSVDTRQGIVNGRVIRIDTSITNGMRIVEVKLEGDLPPGARPGLAVDGTIQITTLNDVVYVGRPVVGSSWSQTGSMSYAQRCSMGKARSTSSRSAADCSREIGLFSLICRHSLHRNACACNDGLSG